MKLRFGNLLAEAWRKAATVSTVVGGFTACWMYLVNTANRQPAMAPYKVSPTEAAPSTRNDSDDMMVSRARKKHTKREASPSPTSSPASSFAVNLGILTNTSNVNELL